MVYAKMVKYWRKRIVRNIYEWIQNDMGKSGSKQKDDYEKKARTKSTKEEEEEEEEENRRRILLWVIDEKDKLKIAREMGGNGMVLKGRNRGEAIWDAFAKELIKEENKEIKDTIIQ